VGSALTAQQADAIAKARAELEWGSNAAGHLVDKKQSKQKPQVASPARKICLILLCKNSILDQTSALNGIEEYIMRAMTRILLVLIWGGGMAAIAPATCWAQRIEAIVETDLRTLPLEKQNKLQNFAEKVQHYINSYNWTDDPWTTTIPVTINLVLQDMTSGAEERYSGNILIHNNYDIQYYDKRWRFAHQTGATLTHDNAAQDSFTSLIDFYIYLILGGEFDKWSTLGGTPYFERAKNIAEQAKFGMGRYIEGWDRRVELVESFLADRHRPYREMVDYYYYGISFVQQDNAKAREHCATAVQMLDKILTDDPNNEYAKKFISAHYMEMLEIFRRAQDKTPLRTLLVLDPEHEVAYREVLEK